MLFVVIWAVSATVLFIWECRAHQDTQRKLIELQCRANIAKVIDDEHARSMKVVGGAGE